MLMHTLVAALLLAAPQSNPTPSAAPRRTTTATATVEIRITDRVGAPTGGARVTAIGPSLRDGTTDTSGVIVFRTVSAGTYRIRAERDGFVTLEKEVTVRAGVPLKAELALSAASSITGATASPATPSSAAKVAAKPPVVTAAPTGTPGETRLLSMTDLAERSLSGKDNLKVVPVGCANVTNARLIVLRDSLPAAAYADAEESLYVIAGEATVTVDAKAQAVSAGWFAMLPRGTRFEIVRRGRNPVILLSQLNGQPCSAASAAMSATSGK